MYVPGTLTGVLLTSLFWLAVIGCLILRHNDALWDVWERATAEGRDDRREDV
jgi:hypothetical protein